MARVEKQDSCGREESRLALKAKLARGAAQAERGEVVDGKVFFERLKGRLRGEGNAASSEEKGMTKGRN